MRNYYIKHTIVWLLLALPLLSIAQKSTSLEIHVAGNCGMCEERIETAALEVTGVKFASWDSEKQTITITGVSVSKKQLSIAIAAVGHDTKLAKASNEVYDKLHGCCKYRSDEAVCESVNLSEEVKGRVWGVTSKGKEILAGANVQWLGTVVGAATNNDGDFSVLRAKGKQHLIVSFVGFVNDTILVGRRSELNIELVDNLQLKEVQVRSRRKSTSVSHLDAKKVQQISEAELEHAACCNLSESFETNPTVDVSFTDAVTGTRQIQMLGLSGPYVQITRENMPDVRGLSAIHGLTYTPGAWVESIQLQQGTGSVVNGYESVTGQINVELRKPEKSDRLFVNLFSSHVGMAEANINWSHKLNDKWSTGLLLHGKYFNTERDDNSDGFVDQPLTKNWIALHRWKYNSGQGLNSQFGVKFSSLESTSGQTDNTEPIEGELWKATMNTKRVEAWGKMGYVWQNKPTRSIGLQVSGLVHEQDSRWGQRPYDATQKTLYGNLIFQDILGQRNHKYKLGASILVDDMDELLGTNTYTRTEVVPGAFAEYTFKHNDAFTLVAGLRADWHSLFGLFATPRLHLRYAPWEQTVLRASAGRGQRTASVIAENIGALASARNFALPNNNDTPYGLDPEVAWNFGASVTQDFKLAGKEITLGVDLYHTRFENQVVVDYEANIRELQLYNLEGESFATSMQVQADFEILPRWNLRVAYRYNDVMVDYKHGRKQKPLTNKFRAFANMSYETEDGWTFNATANWLGQKRIPSTEDNPEGFQLDEYSPEFMLYNAQIGKKWKRFDVYVGGENLLNFTQDNPILSADNPNNELFDASLVWGPVMGRRLYVGLRWRI